MTTKSGDWIAFEKDGRVVIGRVLYRARNHQMLQSVSAYDAITDLGTVNEVNILEIRADVQETK